MPRKAHLLLVDDDPNTLASLSRAFRMAGHEVTVCDNAVRAVELLRSELFDLVFSDVVMPGKTGLDLLEEMKSLGIKTPIIMISGQANIEMAVRATKLGALDFLEKPLSTDKLLLTIENALRLTRLESENQELRRRIGKHELVGGGAAMKKLLGEIERVAASETRVCILGETGTGKELVARAIHEKSPRREGAFITLNCAAVPAELIESALFGHEKGSFTGAAAKHLGKFEQAEGGGRCFWMRLAICRWPCRQNFCACWKKEKWNAWAATSRCPCKCARAGGDAPRPGKAGQGKWVSAGFVPPDLRFSAEAAAVARAKGRLAGPGNAFREAGGGAERLEGKAV